MRRFRNVLLLLIIFMSASMYAQTVVDGKMYNKEGKEMIWVNYTVEDGDTIPIISMPSVLIVQSAGKHNARFNRKFEILKRKVVKVYPYAQEASILLKEYNDDLANMENERDKKSYTKKAEKKLKEEFSGVLKDLTMSEGRILIKLIDRETSNTSYELIDELRGGLTAFMWQGVARLFGSNLKSQYDPNGDDYLIERVVRGIEGGYIQLTASN